MENSVLNDLRKASTHGEVELIFKRDSITDVEKKLKLLKDSQQMDSFYTPNYYELSVENQYAYELSIFLKGDWKKNQLYDKMGL